MSVVYYSDSLYHHGILGMKWGIRRYQPYSTTGPRKGGKTGKEVGEAAKSRKERRAERIEARAEKYRQKEYAKAEKNHRRKLNTLEAWENRALKKYDDAKNVANVNERTKKKVDKRLKRVQYLNKRIETGYEVMNKELDAIKNLTPKDISKEKRAVASAHTMALLASIGSVGLTTAYGEMPIRFYYYVNDANLKTNMRLKNASKKG